MNEKIFKHLKKSLPSISKTEKEALNSGDTWLDSDILQNNIKINEYEYFKYSKFSKKENDFINKELKNLLKMVDSYKINEDKKIPENIMNYLKENRFFSFIIPEEFGGLGFSPSANSYIVAKIASVNSSLAVTVMVPNSLGPSELLLKYGTKKEKDKWLHKLAKGDEFPCFGLTSPYAGSDASSIPDKGIIVEKEIDGVKKIGISLTVDKRYITLAPISTVIGLAFNVFDPNALISDGGNLGITCALIPSKYEGIDISNYHKPMNMAFKNGTIKCNEVFIPLDFVIGGKNNIGKGWEMLMSCLADGRGISLPALATAKSQLNFHQTYLYSSLREQFNTPIKNFEGVEEKLALMLLKNYINESTRSLTLYSLDNKIKPSIITAITKYHTTELSRDILLDSMDIMAGKSIIQGKHNPSWDSYIGMPIAITVEGANILTRNLIIFGQGLIRNHPYLLNEQKFLETDDKENFNTELKKHAFFTLKNLSKTKLRYFKLLFNKKNQLQDLKEFLSYYSGLLCVLSDYALLTLGGKIKFKENISSRLSDILSYLYMSIAVIVYYENNKSLENEIVAKYSLKYLFKELNKSLNEFYNLYPYKNVKILKYATALFGHFNFELKNGESREILSTYESKKFRKQLTNLISFENENYLRDFENAFNEKNKISELLKTLKSIKDCSSPMINEKAKYAFEKGYLKESDYITLLNYHDLLMKVINVDEFKN